MPESVQDRPTISHEYVILLSKGRHYYWDAGATRLPLARPDEPDRKTPARYGGANKHEGYGTRKHSGNVYGKAPEGGRNRRTSDWFFDSLRAILDGGEGMILGEDGEPLGLVVNPRGYKGAHYAVFCPQLVEPMILAGCPPGGTVLDPFCGTGTTLWQANALGRDWIGIDIDPKSIEMAKERMGLFAAEVAL